MGVNKTGTGATPVEKTESEEKPIKPKVIVYFRPTNGYNGEFGFDWLRTGIPNNTDLRYKKYEEIIEAGYNKNHSRDNADLSKKDAYTELKKEYKRTSIPTFGTYHIPYLNLFSKAYSDTVAANINPKPPYKATLKIWLTIEDADVDAIIIESNNDNITINNQKEFSLSDTAKCSLKGSDEITITCLEDITTDEEISVYAYPQGSMSKSEEERKKERILAGKLLVAKNDKSVRKEAKFVFVRVRTNVTGRKAKEKTGIFTEAEQVRLRNTLYQALVRPLIWVKKKNNKGIYEDIVLDLSTDANFKHGGKYIDANNKIDEDAHNGSMFSYLRNKFMNDSTNSYYRGFFPVFVIGEDNYDGALGQVENIGIKNLVLFNNRNRSDQVIGHEALHGFGLWHTHRELRGETIIIQPNKKYIYSYGHRNPNNATDNIMSYNINHMLTTWNWQWKIIRKHI